jgi:hypothetical protein
MNIKALKRLYLKLRLPRTRMSANLTNIRFEFIMNGCNVFLEALRVREDSLANWTFLRSVPSGFGRRRKLCFLLSMKLLVCPELMENSKQIVQLQLTPIYGR